MIKSFTGAVAATALGLTLFSGGVANAADERPIKGTTDCTTLVNSQENVRDAAAQVRFATNTLNDAVRATPVNDADVAAARAALADAQDDLSRIVSNVTSSLCRNGSVPTTDPKPTVVAPAPTTVVQSPTTVVERPTVIDRERISTVAVVPTRDDGSVATTSGSQITVVPEGSASTGQA